MRNLKLKPPNEAKQSLFVNFAAKEMSLESLGLCIAVSADTKLPENNNNTTLYI